MINLMAPFNSLGYGVCGKNILAALEKIGVEPCFFPIGNPQVETQAEHELVQRTTARQKRFPATSPCVKIWHQHDMATRVGKGKFYGWPIFELDTFADNEILHLSSCDELIVCSHWARQQINPSWFQGKTHVVPLGVDTTIFHPDPSVAMPKDKCLFVNIGKTEKRKGHDVLGEAFKEAFPDETDVRLVVAWHNPFLTDSEREDWRIFYHDPRIKIIDERLPTHAHVANLMQQAHCGVFPSRAEGWNLELLEMLACGKHVIATNYSAHTQFCDHDNAMLIEPNGVEPASDGKWFFKQGNWAKFDTADLVKHLRTVYHFWKDGKLNEPVQAALETARQFSWEASAKKLMEVISE